MIAVAAVLGTAAAVVALGARSGPPPAPVVVARVPLATGQLIDEATARSALVTVAAPGAATLANLLARPTEAVGRRIVAPVGAGEPGTQAALGGAPGAGPAPLAAGERAVAVPVAAAGGAAAGLVPGMRVDVVASTGEGLAGRSEVVVRNAEVLGIAVPPGPEGATSSGDVILRTTAGQALRITAALNFAREVRLLVRPAGDDGSAGGAAP